MNTRQKQMPAIDAGIFCVKEGIKMSIYHVGYLRNFKNDV